MRLRPLRKIINLKGWRRTLLIVFIAQLASVMGFSIIFPFLPLYVEYLGSSTGMSLELLAGLVFSAQAFTMMLAGPVWGALADRYGRKLMVQRATFGGAVLLLLMAFVQSGEQLVLLRAVQGLVTGTVAAFNALVAAEAPRERTGFAMGVIQVGLWSGISLGPLVGGVLADAFGFRVPFYFTAVLLLFAGVLVHFGVHEDFTPAEDESVVGGRPQLGLLRKWRHVITMRGVPVTFAVRFFSGLGRNMITPIAPLFVAVLMTAGGGVSTNTGLVVGSASFAGTISAIVLGRLGDRIGHRKVLVGSAIAAGLFYLPQAAVTEVWQLLLLQLATGAATGGVITAPSALLARYTLPGEEGAVYGLDNSVFSGSRALAPLLGSGGAALIGLRATFIIAGAIYLGMAVFAFISLPRDETAVERDAEGALLDARAK